MEIVSPFDMMSVGLILFSGVFAYLRGFVKEILLILNWILAIVVAYLISPPIFRNISEINFIMNVLGDSCELMMIISFILGFILALVTISLVTYRISYLIEISFLNEINKILGLLFGFLRGGIIVIIFLVIYNQVLKETSSLNFIGMSKSNVITLDVQEKIITKYPKNIPEWLIDNYDNLPNTIVFCKNNIFTRHIEYKTFEKLIKREAFTRFEDNKRYRDFPISLKISDNYFNEINSSWYKYKYPRKFFPDYNNFHNYIFQETNNPEFISFAPGANYIVPKANILLRSKNFYKNLKIFISHSQFSCESHFLERSLPSIWNSNLISSKKMDKEIEKKDLDLLQIKYQKIKSNESIFFEKSAQKIIFKLGNFYFRLLKKSIGY